MKRFRNSYIVTVILLLGILLLPYCTKNDQILDIPGTDTGNSSTDLVSTLVTTAPSIDGTIDALWESASKLDITATVPDPGNGLFSGYIGDRYNTTIRSLYDNQYIYMLIEVTDNDKSLLIEPWFFNPTTQRWARESKSRVINQNGAVTREGWGEDKFSFLWNVDNSTSKFAAQTCYASCHVFTPYLDYSVTPPVQRSNANSGNHYTNASAEKIDMWWGHPNRGFTFGKMDDNYQDWAGGPAVTNLTGGNANGRHFDDLVVSGTSTTWPFRPTYTSDATQGSIANTQNLRPDGDPANPTVAVPLWVVPNATNIEFIKASDTNVTAKKVTAVSSTGVLTYDGGTIDPNVGTDYQRVGDPVTGGFGPKVFPGNIVSPVINGRADIDMAAIYTGSGWIYEIKRLLKTNDALKQDVDFTSLEDQPFGFAYWNRNNNQHAIKTNLVLKFKK